MPAPTKTMVLGALNSIECISETLLILLRAMEDRVNLGSFHCQSSDCCERQKLSQEGDNDKTLDSKDNLSLSKPIMA